MSEWNFADVWDVIAAAIPEHTAIVHGDTRLSWADFHRRAAGVATGLAPEFGEGTVALMLYNGPEYLETLYAAFMIGVGPVNTNFRYRADELEQLWSSGDVRVVVFDSTLGETVGEVRTRLGSVRTWVCVGPDGPDWAVPYEDWADRDVPPPAAKRSGDDLFLLYTGGTTGLPKGVMWRQDDMFCNLNGQALHRYREDTPLTEIPGLLPDPAPVHLAACPLMHGAGSITSMSALSQGGTVVLLPSRSFSAVEMLETVEAEGVWTIAITGDAIARPLVEALEADPRRWSLDTVRYIVSSAVAWSTEVKERILAQVPGLRLVDTLGASEGFGAGRSVTQNSTRERSCIGDFLPGRHTVVLADDGRLVQAGSGETGVLAVGGRQPLGYYNDPEASAEVWKTVDGVRYAIGGDMAKIEIDGSITLLGRGSSSINTGGEKVYPHEVEAALTAHPGVRDAAVVGVPNERFGQAVSALVELTGDTPPETEELRAFVRARLAPYKAPKHIAVVDTVPRLANGKLAYQLARAEAERLFGAKS
ncbi:AMP-binding protein [Pseudonocardia sp. NPDC049154]|uniref:AMP-binding protein n=1 Tax=Pseudonocardia sp. NPDC049154 TaxID=3155501 RepID=UPI0033C41E4A